MIPTDTFLHELADLADSVSMPRFEAQDFVVESKPDKTEVTIADRNTELAVTEHILTTFPGHQVLGEEFGVKGDPNGTWRWIIDPIDGTANFTRGVPVWATLIAAEQAGTLRAAMVSCPALHRRWWAIKGAGAFLNGKPIQVSGIRSLADATISFSDGYWQHTANAHLRQALDHVLARCARQKGFGDFWQHMLVAEGALDIALEPVVSLWDLAAVQLIVEEAGGTFSNLQGEPRADGGSALSTNGVLHEQVLSALHAATTNHTSPLQT
jgi:histidinol-phosphatase